MCIERVALLSAVGLTALVTAAGGASAPTRPAVIRNGLIAFGSNRTTQRNEEIYVMNADGTGERRLTTSPGHDSGPVWSPDGKRLAFFSRRGGNTDIYVMNADGSGVRRVTRSPAYDFTPTWSPDGRRLAFLRFPAAEGPHPGDLFVVNVDTGGEQRVARLRGGAPDPVWSPDGRTIAFSGNYGIYLIKIDGTGLRRLTTSPFGPGWDTQPAWSPDGRRIAYVSAGSSTPPGIYLMNADGTGRHRLTFGRSGDGAPAWSPDGRKIVFTCQAGQVSDVCVVGADGKGRLRLTEDEAENRDPSWQPLAG